MIEQISTTDAPGAVGPYSQAIKVGDLLFVSGQLPIDPATGEFNSANAVEQAEQCLRNLRAIAKAAGTELSKTVKTTVLLTDLGDFADVNRVYASFFSPPYPARACYEVKGLPKGAKVEIEAVISLF
ncbi:2-iminobutanoate/2-iminopropanoate deaminase [Rhizobium leguminosarum]|uniref:RidA family protein n=1 Tax=Rhizobium TaxID=379 RepID=UPI0016183E19|nr:MULTISPECIES: RidA family protein [Rhizobium]MBB4299453.1 2-iminobutanoate/2-iminopropanoate deaminase [Rhizobium leguminosarum]MBB4436396.1 2-iminobutanoate/2-iminopropanoate deaminase [Rhizobium esperanzae]MBB5683709.1 2-iminobutanoate/2-iminopropanoate deaminase [Rhizobium leguminosarum]MBB6267738.1 2-iminobutanoate/2-iminopropanoate deaminase [Rhizobium leguminosarum]